jgi:tRNA threonylcarbamoyladenosine biosynthesis protein TsaE
VTEQLRIADLEQLQEFADDFTAELEPGTAVFLIGEMGAGKTTFTACLAKALGISERVVSPTFVLGHEYTSERLPLLHIDAYRIVTATSSVEQILDELEALDIEGALKRGVVVLEWCESVADLIAPQRVEIYITVDKPSETRTVEVKYVGAKKNIPSS